MAVKENRVNLMIMNIRALESSMLALINARSNELFSSVISLIFSVFLFLGPTPALAMSVEQSNKIVKAFNEYVAELKQIENNCEGKMNESDFFC